VLIRQQADLSHHPVNTPAHSIHHRVVTATCDTDRNRRKRKGRTQTMMLLARPARRFHAREMPKKLEIENPTVERHFAIFHLYLVDVSPPALHRVASPRFPFRCRTVLFVT